MEERFNIPEKDLESAHALWPTCMVINGSLQEESSELSSPILKTLVVAGVLSEHAKRASHTFGYFPIEKIPESSRDLLLLLQRATTLLALIQTGCFFIDRGILPTLYNLHAQEIQTVCEEPLFFSDEYTMMPSLFERDTLMLKKMQEIAKAYHQKILFLEYKALSDAALLNLTDQQVTHLCHLDIQCFVIKVQQSLQKNKPPFFKTLSSMEAHLHEVQSIGDVMRYLVTEKGESSRIRSILLALLTEPNEQTKLLSPLNNYRTYTSNTSN